MPKKEEHPYTSEMLSAVISQLERAAGSLTAVREMKDQLDIQILPITNHKELVRGLKKVQAFARAAEDAIDAARLDGVSLPEDAGNAGS